MEPAMKEPLFSVVKNGCIETLSAALSQGIDINAADTKGYTLLHIAVLQNNEEIVKMLIDAGADVNIKDYYGHTALALALTNFSHTGSDLSVMSIMKLLLDAGADMSTIQKRKADELDTLTSNIDCKKRK